MASAESKKAEAKKQKESKHRTGSVCETVSYITLDSIPCFSNVFCIADPALGQFPLQRTMTVGAEPLSATPDAHDSLAAVKTCCIPGTKPILYGWCSLSSMALPIVSKFPDAKAATKSAVLPRLKAASFRGTVSGNTFRAASASKVKSGTGT